MKGTSETCLGMADADLAPCSPSCQVWSMAVEQGWHPLPTPWVLGGLRAGGEVGLVVRKCWTSC